MPETVVAFDLDDTLFKEADFVESAYRNIASALSVKYPALSFQGCVEAMQSGENPFDALMEYISRIGISIDEKIDWCVATYRNHMPDISLSPDTESTLESLIHKGIGLAIITDGRTGTQSHKISALGLKRFIPAENILISEATGYDKHYPQPFIRLMEQYPETKTFYYIGDNLAKDFYWPNKLGWITVCLRDNGRNIHPQNLGDTTEYSPRHVIDRLSEITNLITS